MKMKFGIYLKETREKLNLTLRVVEEMAGISNAYLSQLENDKISNPSPTVLHKLANCYGVSYARLMKLAGYPTSDGQATSPVFRLKGFKSLTKDEEKKLQEYLQFLRLRKQRK